MNLDIALAIFGYVVLVLSISLHDCAQAWMARRLGDPTAQMLGRLTLNPLRHFDLFGTAIWPAIDIFIYHSALLVGWGKTVPVTPRNFRKPVRDEIVAVFAGPAAQLVAAIVCLVLLVLIKHFTPSGRISLAVASALALHNTSVPTEGLPTLFPLVLMLYLGIVTNLLLMVFNMVPLPAFDGGRILRNFLPYNAQKTYDSYGLYLMFAFFFFGFRFIMYIFVPILVIFDSVLRAL